MIYGNAGSGKSSLAIQFAGYLASVLGQSVLYVAAEEGLSYTMQDKLRRFGINSPHLTINSKLPTDLSKYDVVFIDSINHLGLKPEELRSLPSSKSYVYVFQANKNGTYKGDNTFLHDVDTAVEVKDMVAMTHKNRFGGSTGQCDVNE